MMMAHICRLESLVILNTSSWEGRWHAWYAAALPEVREPRICQVISSKGHTAWAVTETREFCIPPPPEAHHFSMMQ